MPVSEPPLRPPFSSARIARMQSGPAADASRTTAVGLVPPARRGRPRLSREVQRRRVLDAAVRVFMDLGFKEASLDAIAREAGVTKRTIYELVGDKSALFCAVCSESAVSVTHHRFPRLINGMGLEGGLYALAESLIAYALEPQLVAFSRMIMAESTRFPDLVRGGLESGRDQMHRGIIAMFEDLERARLANVPNHRGAAELFYDIVVGNHGYRAALGFGEQSMPAAVLRQRLRVFIKGYVELP